ncbi:unnamed protein product [Chrysoparadoxa australica]
MTERRQVTEEEFGALLDLFSPVYRFDAKEKYFPSTAEFILSNSTCFKRGKGEKDWEPETRTPEQVIAEPERRTEYKLEPAEGSWLGQDVTKEDVPVYGLARQLSAGVAIPFLDRAIPNVVELVYYSLFTYNGTTFALPGTEVGVHTGDIEHITVRVDADAKRILEVYYAAHGAGEGKWVPSTEFYEQLKECDPGTTTGDQKAIEPKLLLDTTEDGHPVVYPALAGHASYPAAKTWHRFTLHSALPGLGDDEANGDGVEWKPSVTRLTKDPQPSPAWLNITYLGEVKNITGLGSWKYEGEELRRHHPDFRSMVEEGLYPERAVKLCGWRLLGAVARGVVPVQHTQIEHRAPWSKDGFFGVTRGDEPTDAIQPAEGMKWLHDDWVVLKEAKVTDNDGWMYAANSTEAHKGRAGLGHKNKPTLVMGTTSRRRTWVRFAGSDDVHAAVKAAAAEVEGEEVKLAAAACHACDVGEKVVEKEAVLTLFKAAA